MWEREPRVWLESMADRGDAIGDWVKKINPPQDSAARSKREECAGEHPEGE